MKFGEYQVWKKFASVSGPYTTHQLVLRHIPSAKERTIFHIQYTDWPDHGCPVDIYGFLGMMRYFCKCRRAVLSLFLFYRWRYCFSLKTGTNGTYWFTN